MLTQAHRMAPAPVLSPFVYTQIIWMTLIGFVLFGDVPDVMTIVGGSAVVASGLYVLYRERLVRNPSGDLEMQIGFIGAGLMGHGMAVNLLKAGHEVTVVAHRNRAPVEDLVQRGARKADGLGELAKQSEIIMICVSNSKVVQEVIDGLKPHLAAGQIIVDMGTSDPAVNRRIAAELQGPGDRVRRSAGDGRAGPGGRGGTGRARRRRAETFERIRPVLESLLRLDLACGPGRLRADRQAHLQLPGARHGGPHRRCLQCRPQGRDRLEQAL
jgi:hypothetical protein